MRQHKIILVTLVYFASLCAISSAYAKIPEKEAILQSCTHLFGAPVDAKQNLFDVNQAFVLQVSFNKRGKLAEFAVKPKFFLTIHILSGKSLIGFLLYLLLSFET